MPAPVARIEQANGLLEARQFAAARQAFLRLFPLEPGNPIVLMGLAKCCSALNDVPQAQFFAQRLAALNLRDDGAMQAIARLLIEVGDEKGALAYLDRAVAAFPGSQPLTSLLLQLLYFTRRTKRAKAMCESLIGEGGPLVHEWRGVLGALLRSEGRARAAVDEFRAQIAGLPALPDARMQLAITSMYDDRCTGEQMAEYHRDYGRISGLDARPAERPATNLPDHPRIAFLGPDFVTHSVAYFAEPLIEGLSRLGVTVICYQTGNKEDETTRRFRAAASKFRSVWMLQADELASQIRADKVDVLIDLAGLSLGGRMDALRLHPAPVQINYCGYPASTGCAAHDYRIVDSVTDPAGSERLCTETLLRLDPCFLCYRPRSDAPAPKDPSSASPVTGVTFGSFNIVTKVNDSVIDAWSRILHEVAGSTLALKSNMLKEEGVRQYFEGAFAARGVGADRLRFLGWTESPADHLRLYHGVDIALDPFPYNGTTTTCEALSMGVPVITLEGSHHAARVGTSLLRSVGLGELVTPSVDAYVALAKSLAGDQPRRSRLHAQLPAQFATSPLRDEAGFCDRFLGLLRALPARQDHP